MPEIVIALYRPHAGRDADVARLVAEHLPVLRREGLVTDRPGVVMRSSDGTFLEVFEWVDGGAERAHGNAAVMRVWNALGEVADFPPLASLPEADGRFPHFTPA